MPDQLNKTQFWKLYQKLPKELQEAFSSVDTTNNIWNICERNNVNEVAKIAKYVADILLGILPSDDLREMLEKELKLKKDTAKKVSREIHQFIFYPVRQGLEELYKTEIKLPVEALKIKPSLNEKPKQSPVKDIYRESVE